jgi:hypothetical protein
MLALAGVQPVKPQVQRRGAILTRGGAVKFAALETREGVATSRHHRKPIALRGPEINAASFVVVSQEIDRAVRAAR